MIVSKAGLALGVPAFIAAIVASPPPPLGAPMQGLTSTELQDWNHGKNAFLEIEDKADGLGPVFNGVSCAECHRAGAPGGAGPNVTVARVTRIGGMQGSLYSDLPQFGGPVIQARSLREFDPTYPIPHEVVPPQAQYVSRRYTTPLFGLGLIEAIPEATILAPLHRPAVDGILGQANYFFNPETGRDEVGRFGWKCQVSNLRSFAADAYINEMGITNELHPTENLPQGKPIPAGADVVPDPEDEGNDTDAFATFMRFLAPPSPKPASPLTTRGAQVFNTIHCNACHTPSMQTGPNPSAALSNKTVALWSDLLTHHMGTTLADGVRQGKALGDQWRTAPLWGLSARRFYMHDGRATTIDQAIRLHGGESTIVTGRYGKLNPADPAAILAFLGSL